MVGSVLVLFVFIFSLSVGLGTMIAHMTWSPPIQEVK